MQTWNHQNLHAILRWKFNLTGHRISEMPGWDVPTVNRYSVPFWRANILRNLSWSGIPNHQIHWVQKSPFVCRTRSNHKLNWICPFSFFFFKTRNGFFGWSILTIQDNIPGSMGTCLLSTQIWWQCRPWKSCPGAETKSRNIDNYVCMERNNLLESNFQSIHNNWKWCWWNFSKNWSEGSILKESLSRIE